ncbi:MAG: hypothetical protein R2712_20660 [Vicinamibacterales bacterium]
MPPASILDAMQASGFSAERKVTGGILGEYRARSGRRAPIPAART